jgi:RHS repeat-associated protein
VALVFVAVTQSGPPRPTTPVQQTGTAAGRPHRVSSAADLGRVVDGHLVSGSSPHLPGPVASEVDDLARVPGAVRAAVRPKPLKLPARGKNVPEAVTALKASPAVHKTGFDAKTSWELPPTRADQVVYSNADGTRTAFEYENPVNYRLPDGKWAAISTSLVPSPAAGASSGAVIQTPLTPSPSPSALASPSAASSAAPAGGWTEKSESDPESFASNADDPALVTLPVSGSQSVSFGISGAAAVPGATSGSTVSYADAQPDSTVSFTAGTGLVKESIVLSSASAPDTWLFPLDLKGLRAEMGPGGIVEFADAAGKVLAYVPHGSMTDSDIDPHSGNGATSFGVTYSLVTVRGRQAIKMMFDAAWLDSKSRVYPVTVDPSVKDENADPTTYLLSPYTPDIDDESEIDAGTYDGGSNVAKSYLDFSDVVSGLSNDTVLGARLGLFNTWSWSCSPREVYVYPVTSSWTAGSMTSAPSTGSAVGRSSFATGWVPEGSSSSPCPASWEGMDLDQSGTNLINEWTHDSSSDHGLAVGASASDDYGWKKFASGLDGGNPFLAITYTTDGASYSLGSKRAITNVTPTSAGKFAITVKNTGSSTWDAGNGNGYEISSTAYYAYGGKGKDGTAVSGSQVFTELPSTVAPGQSVKVDAAVGELPGGPYRIVFDMYSGKQSGGTPQSFSSQGIQDFEIGLYVTTPPPTVLAVYPPTGFISSTLQQQLSTTATGTGTVTYDFTLTCEPLTGQTCVDSSVSSGSISKPYWTPPEADLDWNTPFEWSVAVTSTSGSSSSTTPVGTMDIEAEVPQPAITSDLGGSSGQDYDPQSGNYTTSATDAAVKSVGPPLEIDRTYNSMDPRSSGAFGAGWSSALDTSLRNDGSTVTVTLPDGQQMTFGQNGDGTYAAPAGSPDALVESTVGTWTLRDSSGNRYAFTSAGLISSITDVNGYAQDFMYNTSNQVTTITDAVSGRALTLTWSRPAGATYYHVSSVTTPAPASGGSGYTWTYTYADDALTEACAPAATGSGCTAYTSGSGSHYWSSVQDADPRVYYQLGEASGTTAADEVDSNLGTTDGTYANVTLGATGPLAGTSATAASFNGTSSYVSLPNDLVSDSTDVSVGLWFKASSGQDGVLFSYDADAITNSSGSSVARQPALYIGTNGELYGEFWTGSIEPIHTSTSVADGEWHYAVITADSDSQSLYLDGAQVGSTLTGEINQQDNVVDTIGAGFWNSWPEVTSTDASYFSGDISQVAVYAQPLSAARIASQYALATAASPELTQIALPSGKTYEQASYDPDTARLTTYTDPDGGQWTISDPLVTGAKTSSDALGYVVEDVSVTDPAGRHETYGYDMTDGGRLISYDNGVDPPEAYGYDAAGFLTTVVDQGGNLVCLTNDIHGNLLTRTWYPIEPAGLPGTGPGIAPADCGGSTASSPTCESGADQGMPCTTFYGFTTYNEANPLDPTNDLLTSVRDGRSSSATDDTYETKYEYNTIGQLILEITPATSDFPDGRVTRYDYSTGTETAANGGTIPAGLMSSETTPGGAVTSNSYDSDGDLAKVTEPSGRYTDYTYDGLGRVLASTVYTSTYPSGEATSYTYTPTGQQATVTYPPITNSVTNVSHQLQDAYTYDDDNNVLTETESDLTGGDPSRTTTYAYNDHDEVASVTQPAGATTGGTSQSQGASSANPDGATTGYDYDAFGNVSQVTDPDGNEYRYTYNEYQEPTQETLYTTSTNEADSTATCTTPATPDPDGGCDLVLKSYEYDFAGGLAATTDAMGQITNYVYDNNGDLTQSSTTQACSATAPCTSMGSCTPTAPCTTGSVGTMTGYYYDGAGNLTSQQVSATTGGAVGTTTYTDYNYDAADRLTSEVQDAPPPGASSSTGYLNRTTAYTYNADNYVLSKTTGTGSALDVTDYGYDTAGDRTSQTVQNGSTSLETTWTYNQAGQPLSMTTPEGNVSGADAADYTTNYTYDPDGNLVTETGAPVSTQTYGSQSPAVTRPVTTYGYDTFGDKTQTQDPDGNVTTSTYDGDSRVASVTQAAYTPPGGSSSITAPTTYAYDEDGNLAQVTDPEGNVTSYTYDALADKTAETTPLGTTNYTYDADGEQLSATDPLNNETQSTWNYFGDQASSTDARDYTTNYSYDYLGDQLTATTPDGSATTSTYDHLGELTSTADTLGDTTSYAYNDQGQVSQVQNPDTSYAQFAYDEAGDLTSVADYSAAPAGEAATELRSESFGYDPDGDQTSVKDWDGNTTTYGYNAAGSLTSEVAPVTSSTSDTTSYGYDAAGNQTSVTDPDGNTTWTTYNSWDLPESVIKPLTTTATTAADTTWTTAYNADGQAATVTQPGGITQTYGYNGAGEVTSQAGSGASAATSTQTLGYDADGRLTSATAPGGTDSYTYNPDSELSSASGPSGTSSYSYNDDDLVSSETDAAGTTSYTYDSADRLSTEKDPLTGATLTYGYNADSQPTSIGYSVSGASGPSQALTYNQLDELASDTLTSSSGTTLASESYGYDNDGDVTSQATTGLAGSGTTTYGYDEDNELTSSTTGGTTTSYSYNGDGDLTAAGGTSYSYNAQDQLTSSTSSAGTTSYAYTLSGALSSVTAPGGTTGYTSNAFGQEVSAGGVSYAYDALGRLTSRTSGSSTTDLSYLGTGDTIASDGTDDYTYTPSGTLTSAGTVGGTGYSTLSDLHDDVTATFSPASTASSLEGSATYSPYGTATGSGWMPGLGYQQDYTDPATGQVDMNARWYDPATGSFTAGDTITGSPLSTTIDGNNYAYVDGNPVTDTDPTGHGDAGGAVDVLETGLAEAEADPATYNPWGLAIETVGTLTFAGLVYEFGRPSSSSESSGPAPCNISCGAPPDIPYEPISCDISCGAPPILGLEPGWGVTVGNTQPGTGTGGSPVPVVGGCGISYACPPPLPPQDCYAGPDPTCKPSAPPGSLLHDPVITHKVKLITNYLDLCKHGLCITETNKSKQGQVKGTTPSTTTSTNDDNGDQNDKQLLAPIGDQGTPATPEPSGGNVGDGGNGKAPTQNDNACEPEESAGDYIDLYHGTSAAGAASIRANGIDLTAGRPDPDFGPGFYTTQLIEQAEEWASRSENPEILHFQVPVSALEELSGRTFASADEDYSDLVMNGRTEGPMHGYDYVQGPLLRNPQDFVAGAPPVTMGNQVSFHTEAGTQLLMGNLCND